MQHNPELVLTRRRRTVTREKVIADCRSVLLLTNPEVDRATLKTAKGTRVSGTCEWIREEPNYQQWLEGSTPFLWICGGPGKGKTMLSVFLVEELEHKQSVVYYFCTNEDERRNNASAVLRSILWQVTRIYPDLTEHFLTLLGAGESDAARRTKVSLSSVETLWMAFTTICRDPKVRISNLTLILDGLDECDKESRDWLAAKFCDLVTGLDAQDIAPLRIMIVSREIPRLKMCSKLGLLRLDPDCDGKIGEDVQKFVSARVQDLWAQHGLDENLRRHVESTLLERSEGSFLWVGFAIAELLKKQTLIEIEQCLDDLPVGLPAFYGRMLRQIAAQDTDKIARLLQWTTLSARPLSLTEFAAAIDCKATRLRSTEEVVRDLVTLCQPFLAIQSKAIAELENKSTDDKLNIDDEQTVTLIHQSARDFLDSPEMPAKFRFDSEELHFKIAWRCMDLIQCGAEAREANIMLEYAIEYWPAHARKASQLAKPLLDHPSGFFGEHSRVQSWWWYQKRARRILYDSPHYNDTLHLSAYIGFVPWVEKLLAPGWWFKPKTNHVDRLLRKTPLQHAARRGHGTVMRLLLEHSAKTNSYEYGVRQLPAIHIFAESGNEMAVRICLDHGMHLAGAGKEQQTPLHLAAAEGNDGVVRLLLSAGADCEAKDIHGRCALTWAASRGHCVVVRSLLDHGARIELKDRNLAAAWRLAGERGHEKVKKMLLDHGALFDDATALCIAASQGNGVEVRLQLDGGVSVDAKNLEGMTALHCATLGGHDAVVQVLIDHGADINAVAHRERTALHLAVEREARRRCSNDTTSPPLVAIIDALLDHGAEVNAEDVNGMTPLHYAVQDTSGRLSQLLLDRGAQIDARRLNGETPLHILAGFAWWTEEKGMTLLLERGPRIDAKDEGGLTPLHCAARRDGGNKISLLLDHGAHVDARDHRGWTPLHMAVASTSSMDALRRLVDHDADINALDNDGMTPLDHIPRKLGNWKSDYLIQRGAVEGRRI
jgi:ankyrin repeat protein